MGAEHSLGIVSIGLMVIITAAVEALSRRRSFPAVVVYLGLGVGVRGLDQRWQMLGDNGRAGFALLSDLGVVVLLFRVGLESKLAALLVVSQFEISPSRPVS